MPVVCLSLTQPWATLVVAGLKRIETRSWCPGHRGRLAIHASLGARLDVLTLCRTSPFREALESLGLAYHTLPRGCVVGEVLLLDCVAIIGRDRPTEGQRCVGIDEEDILRIWHPFEVCKAKGHSGDGHDGLAEHEHAFGDYGPGRFAWLLDAPVAYREPKPCKGRRRLFEIDESLCEGQ